MLTNSESTALESNPRSEMHSSSLVLPEARGGHCVSVQGPWGHSADHGRAQWQPAERQRHFPRQDVGSNIRLRTHGALPCAGWVMVACQLTFPSLSFPVAKIVITLMPTSRVAVKN